jgi:hypothetical protein
MWDLAFVGRDIGGTTVWGQRVRVVVVVVVGVVCTVQFNTVDAITVDAILLLPFDAMDNTFHSQCFLFNHLCDCVLPVGSARGERAPKDNSGWVPEAKISWATPPAPSCLRHDQ